MIKIGIVDYKINNLLSIFRAVQLQGVEPIICKTSEHILDCDKIILPGVGAFPDGVKELQNIGLFSPIQEFAKSGKSVLGICLGMQLLHTLSEEITETTGLDLIQGKIQKLPKETELGKTLVPHVGWEKLQTAQTWNGTVLENCSEDSFVYFVHSFYSIPENPKDVLAFCNFYGQNITAAVKKDNVTGLQFHPEKSGKVGLEILKQFIFN